MGLQLFNMIICLCIAVVTQSLKVTTVITISSTSVYATMIALLLCFKQTYKNINRRLEKINLSQNGLDDSEFTRRMTLQGVYYKKMKSAVHCFNKFFGFSIFLLLGSIIFSALGWLSLVIFSDTPFLVHVTVMPVNVLTSIIIIFCYDSVLEEAERSIFISLTLFEKLPWKSPKRKEVSAFMEICKEYAPVFTVLGLFRINRSTMLGLVNIISTYLIVLIQSRKT
ncbi:unnamed protein product [Acanthoscelides obtectus]|uniref:Uncharacterized protein n=1 Tax=Acanthoscelides obtectus TaxID=200917 RepID=A0A9P0QCL2_ACAOB|nr:unnamed protein product [Acanthoscelides obtectus]CAK1621619.1 hypothetical protein AOBTE_LOCUS1045 [Acanthoscelides obtectus]